MTDAAGTSIHSIDPYVLLPLSVDAAISCLGCLRSMELPHVAAPEGYISEGWVNSDDGLPDGTFEMDVGGTYCEIMSICNDIQRWRERVLAAQVAGFLLPLDEAPKTLTGRYFALLHEAILDLAAETVATLSPPDPEAGVPLSFDTVAFLPLARRIRAALDGGIDEWIYKEHQSAVMYASRRGNEHVWLDRARAHSPVLASDPRAEDVDTSTPPIRFVDQRAVQVLRADRTWKSVILTAAAVDGFRLLAQCYPGGLSREQLCDALPGTDPVRPLNAARSAHSEIRLVFSRPEVSRPRPGLDKENRIPNLGLYRLVSPLRPAGT